MVGTGSHIDIHTLTLDELAGVVNLYPWYSAARVELCRRMSQMGGDSWGEAQFAAEALFVPDRTILSDMLRSSVASDYSDKEVTKLLASYMEQSAAEEERQVRVVGGDYFSQSQYDKVRQGDDNIFSRFAGKKPAEGASQDESLSEIANQFATETLARIFAEQGRPEEAKLIYSRLILDFPEKSAYFASLIDKLN